MKMQLKLFLVYLCVFVSFYMVYGAECTVFIQNLQLVSGGGVLMVDDTFMSCMLWKEYPNASLNLIFHL